MIGAFWLHVFLRPSEGLCLGPQMYCDGYKDRLRTTMTSFVTTRVGCMKTIRLT